MILCSQCILLSIISMHSLFLCEATVTLTAPSSPPCFGQTYKLTCTHPVPDADTNIRWERNGTGFNPQSTNNHDKDDPTPTTTTLTITVTKEEFENIVYTYSCLTVNTSTDTVVRIYSNNVTVDPPETVAITNVSYQNRSQSNCLFWKVKDQMCFTNISYNITHCIKSNGVPVMSSCVSNVPGYINIENFTIRPLIPNSLYHVTIQAASIQYPLETFSVVHEMDIFTLMAQIVTFRPNTVCYDRQVQLTCHHHDITDTTSSGPIFNQTSPVVWMKGGERIDLPDTYHMVVSQSNTETVVSVTTRKSVFLNGEANYSCAVVYADGSMEESEPVTVRVQDVPFSPNLHECKHNGTDIIANWSHSDECFENCTFMYEVTWQQSGDGSSLGNTTATETSYTIEALTPGTSYEIGVKAYCKGNTSGNVTRICILPTDSANQVCSVWWCIWFPVLVVICIILVIIAIIWYKKRRQLKDCLLFRDIRHKEDIKEQPSSNHPSPVVVEEASDCEEAIKSPVLVSDSQCCDEHAVSPKSLIPVQSRPQDIEPQQPTSYFAEINEEETPASHLTVPDVIETNKETKMSDEVSKTVSKNNEPQQQATSYYADLDHSKDRPRAIANPSLGDGVYDEVQTRK